jgi:diaminopimelate epimerase
MRVSFSKMHGLGNDFVVVDNRDVGLNLTAELACRLADRKHGIGCDQLLLVERPRTLGPHLAMRIFNADGSEVEHCGNGARAVARYAARHGLVESHDMCLELRNGQINAFVNDAGQVTIDMGEPDFEPARVPFVTAAKMQVYTVTAAGKDVELGVVSVGNPHAVLEVADVDGFALEEIGVALQSHPAFPARVNVGAAQIVSRSNLRLRVFERGVGETLACGTGACAAMAVMRRRGLVDENVEIDLLGGVLKLRWEGPGAALHMSGPAEFVFDGEIEV